MKIGSKKFLLEGILCFLAVSVYALNIRNFSASHLGMEDGMRTQRVYSICQTKDGAIWWSSKDGVERFNGTIVRYYPLGTDEKMGINSAQKVKLYKEGDDLYAYDLAGIICRYNAVYDRFEQMMNVQDYQKESFALIDAKRDGDVWWLAMTNGVFRFDGKKMTAIQKGLYASCVFHVGKRLFFGTSTGLFRLSGQDKLERVAPYNVECGYYDEKYKRIWLGTFNEGVVTGIMGSQTIQFTPCRNANGEDMPHNPVRSICPYDDKEMIVGIDGFGVYAAQRSGSDFNLLANANNGNLGVLHGNGVYSAVCDSWGNIIIGSYSGGIDILKGLSAVSAVFNSELNNPQSLSNGHVNCILQTSRGKLVMGTDDGMDVLDLSTGLWKHFIKGNVVISLCEDRNGKIYAATYGKGVYEVGEQSVSPCYSTAEGTLKTDYVFSVLPARDGTLWMGCFNGQLVAKGAGGTSYYSIDLVQKMAELPDGRIIVANSHGISVIDPKTKKMTQQPYYAAGDNSVNLSVRDIYLKNGWQLWVATDGGGVYFYDMKTKRTAHLTTKEGLPSNGVRSLCEDKQGRIWIATDRGMCFVDSQMKVSNLNFYVGLEREYCDHAAERLANGELFFGSTDGAVIVAPDRVGSINYDVKLHLLRIQPDGNATYSDEDIERFYKMLHKREVSFSYSERTFELFYEGISLPNQHDIVYCYQMDEGNWSQPTSQQMIRFSQTEPGTHTMKLRCMSRTCGTVLDEVSLTITIAQPWWNSWWMWCIYLLLLIGLINLIWRMYRMHDRYMRLTVEMAQRGTTEKVKPDDANKDEDGDDEEEEPADNTFVNRVTELVVANLKDPDFTIDHLCREMAMSRTSFYIQLKSLTGKSPQDFIRVIRLERAASLLRAGKSVTEVAMLTGFDNTKYFSTVFKKYFNVPPSKYKLEEV